MRAWMDSGVSLRARLAGVNVFAVRAVRAADGEDSGVADIGGDNLHFGRQVKFVDGAEYRVEIGALARSENAEAQFFPGAHGRVILPSSAVVERPGTSGRISISAPQASSAPRSSASSESGV